MVAAMDAELACGVRVGALLNVLDVGAVDADRHVVLGLAGDGAGVAADASPIVNHESVVHHGISIR